MAKPIIVVSENILQKLYFDKHKGLSLTHLHFEYRNHISYNLLRERLLQYIFIVMLESVEPFSAVALTHRKSLFPKWAKGDFNVTPKGEYYYIGVMPEGKWVHLK